MATLIDKLLATTEDLTGHLGPLTALIDTLVSRIAPSTTARACGGNFFCHTGCCRAGVCCIHDPNCTATCNFYANTPFDCENGNEIACLAGCGC